MPFTGKAKTIYNDSAVQRFNYYTTRTPSEKKSHLNIKARIGQVTRL